ncbi:MAG: hypothetical protein AABZ12_05290 [Planctomycetota bacterium]
MRREFFGLSLIGLVAVAVVVWTSSKSATYAQTSGCTEPIVDTDGDGICDQLDSCAASDLAELLVIDGCATNVPNAVSDVGCSMADEVEICAVDARNHGKFVSCVAKLAKVWQQSGLIERSQKGKIVRCAAKANIPPQP